MPFRKASAPAERRKDRSCPRSQATAASIYGNIPEMSDKALRSTRNSGTDRAESLCSPRARAAPYPMCTTQAEHSLVRYAVGVLPARASRSKYFGEGCPYSLPWVPPSTSGSGPKLHQGLLRMRSRSAKRSL